MSSHPFRTAAVALTASALLLALAACAPAVPTTSSNPTNSAAGSTTGTTPTPTATPAAVIPTQPASRFTVGCGDLIGTTALASLYSVPMSTADPVSVDRANLDPGISDSQYILDLGGLYCQWNDGNVGSKINHQVTLSVLPVTPAEWKTAHADAEGDPISATANVRCDDSGSEIGDITGNGCTYLGYVNSSRLDIRFDNFTPAVSSNPKVMPAAVSSLVKTITAAIAASPLAPAAAPQATAVTLPAGPKLITVDAVRTALALPASQKLRVECDGPFDGPWAAFAEARTQVMGGIGCGFGTEEGDSGENYAIIDYLPAGQWAASQLIAATPSEAPVAVPNLPAGDSFTEYTDNNKWIWGELVIGGNLISFTMTTPYDNELAHPKVTVPVAMVNLAEAFEKTIRGS